MPRSGSGGYSLPAGNPVVTGTVISSTDFNNTMTDLATAMAGSLASDGQTAWAGNQNANGNRLTALPLPAAFTDAGTAGDMQNGRLTYLTTVAGTNTITASVALLTAYTTGETFRFIAANTNTGSVTLNINGIGAATITKRSSFALAPGDIVAGAIVTVVYDGARFQIQNAGTGLLIGVQTITVTGTYTPTNGTNSVVVTLVAGGGGGGGTAATGAGQQAAAPGGSAGGWATSYLTSGFAGVTVTIGAGGITNTGGAGGNGGTTSFGAVFSATGGSGGALGPALSTATAALTQGPAGGGSSGANIAGASGGQGGMAFYTAGGGVVGGMGGAGYFGQGGTSVIGSSNGTAATAKGGGGGGAAQGTASAVALTGGGGGAGLAIIWEYA
jgi:stage V sporulation protein SpoVS